MKLKKKVFEYDFVLTNFKPFKAALRVIEDNFIRKNQKSHFKINKTRFK